MKLVDCGSNIHKSNYQKYPQEELIRNHFGADGRSFPVSLLLQLHIQETGHQEMSEYHGCRYP